jgi:hypothetical protein
MANPSMDRDGVAWLRQVSVHVVSLTRREAGLVGNTSVVFVVGAVGNCGAGRRAVQAVPESASSSRNAWRSELGVARWRGGWPCRSGHPAACSRPTSSLSSRPAV